MTRLAVVAWALTLVTLGTAGCPEVTAGPAGRPCESNEECGPEAHCAPATKTCVTGTAPDLSGPDLDAGPDVAVDAPQPDAASDAPQQDAAQLDATTDTTQPDHQSPDIGPQPDLGCPTGTTLCGSDCVDLTNNIDHCGQCFKTCDDTNDCTADGCAQGACQNLPKPNGAGCDDGDICTYLDQCQSGSCQGTSATCSDGLSCTTDSCTGNPPPDECSSQLNPGNCLVGSTCLADNASLDSCNQCKTSISIASWTPGAGCVTTLAGEGPIGHKDGPQLSAWFDDPCGVAVDTAGKVYVADRDNHVIRVIADGTVSTLAGVVGQLGFADGPAASAQFNLPYGLALDAAGKLYVADSDNNRIRVITISTGAVSTLAGSGPSGNLDGPALTVARFDDPVGVAVDATGKVYVADRDNHKIRVISAGAVSTLAGTGVAGYQDGAASQAQFYGPHGVAVDAAGAVYVTDRFNHRIRKIAGGTVTTIAGSGPLVGAFQDGPVSSARLNAPLGIVVDPSGKVFFSDNENERIRVVSGGVVSTVAGSGLVGHQDGPALSAELDDPYHLTLHAGLIYIADSDNGMIRLFRPQ